MISQRCPKCVNGAVFPDAGPRPVLAGGAVAEVRDGVDGEFREGIAGFSGGRRAGCCGCGDDVSYRARSTPPNGNRVEALRG